MTLPPSSWPRLKEVFAAARALPADARPAYLAAACGGDEALRQEVESLLASDERAENFLESPAAVRRHQRDEEPRGSAHRAVPGRVADRRGRHGRGLSRPRHDAESRRRDQGPAAGRSPAIPSASPASSAKRSSSRRSIIPTSRRSTASKKSDGVHALVMELVEGPTLAERIAQGRDAPRRGAADREADRRGARSRARAGHHPSGSEAREHQGPRRTARSRCSTSGWRKPSLPHERRSGAIR